VKAEIFAEDLSESKESKGIVTPITAAVGKRRRPRPSAA
jgi:hypothetical protein